MVVSLKIPVSLDNNSGRKFIECKHHELRSTFLKFATIHDFAHGAKGRILWEIGPDHSNTENSLLDQCVCPPLCVPRLQWSRWKRAERAEKCGRTITYYHK